MLFQDPDEPHTLISLKLDPMRELQGAQAGKSQKEGQHDRGTLRALIRGGSPSSFTSGSPGIPSGSSLCSLELRHAGI